MEWAFHVVKWMCHSKETDLVLFTDVAPYDKIRKGWYDY
jgi:hypothetical protein